MEKPELVQLLAELGQTLSDSDKEDIAVMALKVVAADGRREVAEMERFNEAVQAIGVSPEVVHRAFDRLEGTTLVVETDAGSESYDSQFLVAALMIFVARGSGSIEPEESAKMLDLIEEHFQMPGAE